MRNEGKLGQWNFGGEEAFTNDHTPIFITYPVKAGVAAMPAGMLLALDAGGEVYPYDGNGSLAGVNNAPYVEDDEQCSCLAHGTAKARLLVKAGEAALDDADITALRAMGVFPV